MQLEAILEKWEEDGKVDSSELGDELAKIPYLHHRYLKIYSSEKLLLAKLRNDSKILYNLKRQYFSGTLDQETMREKNWPPFQQRLLKEDIALYIGADQEYLEIQLRISYQEEKIAALESILKMINNRGFNIKSQIEWLRFTNGS